MPTSWEARDGIVLLLHGAVDHHAHLLLSAADGFQITTGFNVPRSFGGDACAEVGIREERKSGAAFQYN